MPYRTIPYSNRLMIHCPLLLASIGFHLIYSIQILPAIIHLIFFLHESKLIQILQLNRISFEYKL